jgi:hypothetical protein
MRLFSSQRVLVDVVIEDSRVILLVLQFGADFSVSSSWRHVFVTDHPGGADL